MIKVLVVDDSPTARFILSELINTAPDMQVIAEADSSTKVLSLVQTLAPNVILMDLFMPNADGIQTTKEIMSNNPTPIVIISGGLSDKTLDQSSTIQALRHGALAVVKKPENLMQAENSSEAKTIIDTVRSMSSVRVITHYPRSEESKKTAQTNFNPDYQGEAKIVGIAVSTGGPNTLLTILKDLPADFPVPIVIVQHITAQFLQPLVAWLGGLSKVKISIAQEGEIALKGHVYFAPIGKQLSLTRSGRFSLTEAPKTLHIPSADVLFQSLAQVYGRNAIGVELTGMGEDGVQGLKAMALQGAFTIAQDEASSVVFGMPKAAVEAGAVRQVAPLHEIASILETLLQKKEA
jgi:two-component system, chemotaxis family, protein-glutamate methylesterase/glutaminase